MLDIQKLGWFLLISGSALTPFILCAQEKNPIDYQSNVNANDVIENYYIDFNALAKSEKWQEIISQGVIALEAARNANRPHDEAKICAQLTSTAFYIGNYTEALMYASRCHQLSKQFEDPALFIRALYLESAIYRALANKMVEEQAQQAYYLRAVEIAEEASMIYSESDIKDINLKGKIYLNLGAAYADNPHGDLEAAINYYSIAFECFKLVKANDDIIRISIRLGKVYLLQKKYDLSEKIINEVRAKITNARLAMHLDYLEAQLKVAINDIENAIKIARNGLTHARNLGAKEDELRLMSLLQKIEGL